uniref:Tight junction-associated protein 1 n=1 Tax=Trichuris muris TaxID=70415 RepID=A0A5S6Q4Z2_TRIMR
METQNDAQAEIVLWKEKYERLLHTFTLTLENNQKLEDSVLKLIDQSEQDKASMVNEIDHLNQLIAVKDAMTNRLEIERDRYKKDCLLAVNLLQCQPSMYKRTQSSSEKEGTSSGSLAPVDTDSKAGLLACSSATFPPTAVMLPRESPPPELIQSSSQSDNGHSKDILELISLTRNTDVPVQLRECANCSSIILLRDQSVQTDVSSLSNEPLLIDFNTDVQKHSISVNTKEHSILLI